MAVLGLGIKHKLADNGSHHVDVKLHLLHILNEDISVTKYNIYVSFV